MTAMPYSMDSAPPVSAELETKALSLRDQAKGIAIKNDDDFRQGGDFLKGILALKKEILGVFDPIVEQAHKAHKAATDAKKKALAPVEDAERIIKGSLSGYQLEQERARRQLQEEERLRVEAEKEAIESAAKELADAGEYTAAKALIREEYDIKPVAPALATPKQEGISFRDNWRFQIVDISKIPPEYLIVDEKAIGAVVRAMKEKTNIPGVRVYAEKVAVGRV